MKNVFHDASKINQGIAYGSHIRSVVITSTMNL